MSDTYIKLSIAWREKHYSFLKWCFKYHKANYEDFFTFKGTNENNNLLLDDKIITQDEVVEILTIYYDDNTSNYQTFFGDFIYLCFTDLVTNEADILTEALDN